MPPGVSDSETIQPKNVEPWAYLGSQIPDSRRLRVASLKTETVFESAIEGRAPRLAFEGQDASLVGRPESER
jgi:hypothetical protein